MKLFYPDIFKRFQCTGSKCRDNCCRTGWDIEIDNDTYVFYQSLNDEMGKRLLASIKEEDGCRYLVHEGGCPFLNKEGLCSVLLKYGENRISEICANHPRFFEWFGGYKEAGTGLACEESARLWLSENKITFSSCETDEPEDNLDFNGNILISMLSVRKALINLAQNRNFTFSQRLKLLVLYAGNIQNALDFDDFNELRAIAEILSEEKILKEQISRIYDETPLSEPDIWKDILKYYQMLDYLGENLPQKLESAYQNITQIIAKRTEFLNARPESIIEYENILVYYIFRYFIKSVRQYDAASKLIFAAISTAAIEIMDIDKWLKSGKLGLAEQIEIVKEYSKEIDYSYDNTEKIFEDIYTESILSVSRLLKIL